MTPERLNELEALANAATPGPWKPSDDEDGDQVLWGPDGDWLANIGNWARQNLGIEPPEYSHTEATAIARQYVEMIDKADADFMSAARTALPELIARVRELEAELKALKQWTNSTV